MLANFIALVTLAVMLGSEASRARRPWNYVLWSLTATILIVAVGLEALSERIPAAGTSLAFVTTVFRSPVSWFVLLLGLFIVLHPFWAQGDHFNQAVTPNNTEDSLQLLRSRAGILARRIADYRNTGRLWRDRLPPLITIINDCNSLLLSFEKEGFTVPSFETNEAERIAVGMEHYFTVLHPLIRDGHTEIARENSSRLAEAPVQKSCALQPSEWWQSNPYSY